MFTEMIKEIWIVEKQSAKTLLHRSYRETQTSSTLMSGFLQAIYGLYQYAESELASTEGGKGLESLNMVGMRWLYIDQRGIIFVAATDKETPIELLQEQLKLIATTFMDKFGSPIEALYSGGIDKWLDKDFSVFLPELDDIITQWEKMKTVESAAKLMDFLDVIQNVMERLQNFPGFHYLVEEGLLDILGQAFSDGNWDMSFLSSLDEQHMRTAIESVLTQIMTYFRSELTDAPFLCMKHLHPYIKSDWPRIKAAKLDELFVQLFI